MNLFTNIYKNRDLRQFDECNLTAYYRDEWPAMYLEYPNNWTSCTFERVKNIDPVLSTYDIAESVNVPIGDIFTGTDKTIIQTRNVEFTPGLWQMKLVNATATYLTDIYKILDQDV